MNPIKFSSRINRLTGSLIRETLALTQKPGMISFAGGLPSEEVMPRLAMQNVPQSLGQYGMTEGEPELRAFIAHRLTALGRRCKPEQVLITSGSQQGIDLVSKLFIDPGTPVVIEAPSYLAAIQSFRLFGADFILHPLSQEGIDSEQWLSSILRYQPAFSYLIPTFQNPSGVCYNRTERESLAEIFDRTGGLLVEDEPYRELAYDVVDRHPLCGYLQKAPWIYLGSFSKTGLPGLRIGYLAASEDLFPLFVRLKQSADLHTSRIGQWWTHQFISSADYPAHLDRLSAYYRHKRDIMGEALKSHFGDIARWDTPKGGLFFWIRLNQSVDTREILKRVLEKNVAFMPGKPFFAADDPPQGFLRLNFSRSFPFEIEKGIALLGQMIRQQVQ